MPIYIEQENIRKFSKLELFAKEAVEGFITGLHKSPFHGFSVEFAEHRIYNPGESTKHIDWKLYGRTDKFFTKRYEEETNLRCHVAIDTSSSMFFPYQEEKNKHYFSIHAAAALMQLMRSQRDAVGLSFFNHQVDEFIPCKTSFTHHRMIFSKLEESLNAQAEEITSSPVNCLHEISDRNHKRSLIVIFSDMIDHSENHEKLFGALQHLRYNKHEVVLFHVVDKEKEENLNFSNAPYIFHDLETGEEVKLNPFQAKEKYTELKNKTLTQVREKCLQYKIDYVEADINEGYQKVLEKYLVKRLKIS